jgi:geranylgeranylglycerol-phosphate geranylgeranyltransferase
MAEISCEPFPRVVSGKPHLSGDDKEPDVPRIITLRYIENTKIQERSFCILLQNAMNELLAYFKMARPGNAIMTGIAIALGFWLSRNTLPLPGLALLIIAGICATAFGNVINDMKDVATDRISHPQRPLPRGELSIAAVWGYLVFLALSALGSSLFVSKTHAIATLLPLLLLSVYTLYLKGTPLFGNILVSLLVAYALLFGGLTAPHFSRLLLPATLAFTLNLIREIIKDLQDEPGDHAAGIVTTARLPGPVIRITVFSLCALYLLLLFLPSITGQFGLTYALICAIVIVPMHCRWIFLFVKKERNGRLPFLSLLIKGEMLAGLAALALDQLIG